MVVSLCLVGRTSGHPWSACACADETLAARHHAVQTWSLSALENIVTVLDAQGPAPLPKARGEAARLRKSIALNIWLLWSARISFLKVEKTESQLVRGNTARCHADV